MSKLDTTEGHFLDRLLDVVDQLSAGGGEEDTDSPTVVDFTGQDERDLFSELLELEEATLKHSNEVVRDVLLFKRMVKQQGMDLRKFINPKTKRLHYKLHQLGTATGRCSSSQPNVQQIPARLYLEAACEFSNLFVSNSNSDHLTNLGWS